MSIRLLPPLADAPPSPGTTIWHYILTLQWIRNGKQTVRGHDGTIEVRGNASRSEILTYLRRQVDLPDGADDEGVVLFFSLEPEALSGYRTKHDPDPEENEQ